MGGHGSWLFILTFSAIAKGLTGFRVLGLTFTIFRIKINVYDKTSQCPLTGFEKKNLSKVCHIFLESISYENSKMVCLKILALGIFELTLLNSPEKP